jgi:hypothetical protein
MSFPVWDPHQRVSYKHAQNQTPHVSGNTTTNSGELSQQKVKNEQRTSQPSKVYKIEEEASHNQVRASHIDIVESYTIIVQNDRARHIGTQK